MEDVIFAGTAGRAAAGPRRGHAHHRQLRRRAADRLHRGLDHPPDVPLRRERVRDQRRHAAGCSTSRSCCRDSGIGREMHVIVGQGQLDAVLHASPEDRRAFIEEAAGVLKHRKRKEKALRKLDAMQANLNRLDRPHRRAAPPAQAAGPAGRGGPPGRRRPGRPARRPAAAARRRPGHAARRPSTGRSPTRPRCASGARRSRREHAEVAARGSAELEARARRATRRCCRAPRTPGTSSPRCRSGSAASTSSPRERQPPPAAAAPTTSAPAATPTSWRPRPSGSASRRRSCARRSTDDQDRLAEAVERRQELERALAAAERALVAAAKAHRRPARGPGQAHRPGRAAARPRTDRAGEEIERLAAAPPRPPTAPRSPPSGSPTRRGAASTEADRRRRRPGRRGTRRRSPRTTGRQAAVARARPTPSGPPSRTRATWKAREEALALGLRRKDGAGALLAAPARCPGLLGSRRRAAHRRSPAHEVGARRRARRARRRGRRRRRRRGRRGAASCSRRRRRPGRPAGRRPAAAPVPPATAGPSCPTAPAGRSTWSSAPAELRRRWHRALRRRGRSSPTSPPPSTLVAHAPASCARSPPTATCSAPTGRPAARPRRPATSRCRPRVDEAAAELADRRARAAPSCATELAAARAEAAAAPGGRRRRRPRAKREADGQRNAAAPPSSPSSARRPGRPTAEAERLGAARGGPRQAREQATWPRWPSWRSGCAAAEADPGRRGARPPRSATSCAARCRRPGRHEMEARLAVRTAEERVARARRPGRRRCAARPRQERAARERAAARRAARARGAGDRRARSRAGAETALDRARRRRSPRPPPSRDARRRGPRRAARPSCWRSAAAARAARRRSWTGSPTRCTATRWPAPSSGCASSSWRRRPPRSSASTCDTLLAEYGPAAPVPPTAGRGRRGRGGRASRCPSRCPTTGRRRRSGPPRPSATWPCSARSTRWRWRSSRRWRSGTSSSPTQLEDLKATRADLLTVVKDVDERILEVFAAAFADTAREFEQRLRRRCSRAARAGWCSPTPTTCSPPASRSRPGRRARRSSGCRCCPAASGR